MPPKVRPPQPKRRRIDSDDIREDKDTDFDIDAVGISDESDDDEEEYDDDEEDVGPSSPQSERCTTNNDNDNDCTYDTEIQTVNNGHYLPYSSDWTPHYLYRLPADIVATCIRESRSEGLGRNEMARRLCIDSTTKAGNRRISANIQTIVKSYPKHIGQFQKMEGKVRIIRYFWKEDSEPAKFTQLYGEIEKLIGRPCPFKMGQVIKFPSDTGLSTFRLSDVSLSRLLSIIRLTTQQKVIVTIHKLMKIIQKEEESNGYMYQVDKRSMMKCLITLEKEKLIRIHSKEFADEKISIITHPDIIDPDCDEVIDAIKYTVDEYNRDSRIFPHGQYRLGTKVLKAAGLKEEAEKEEEQLLTNLEENVRSNGRMTIEERFELFRLQANRFGNEQSRKRDREKARKANRINEDEDNEEDDDEGIDDRDMNDDDDDGDIIKKMEGRRCDRGNEFGYQSKMLRYMLLHEIAFQITRGAQKERPTLFDRFPCGRLVDEWNTLTYYDIPVYVDEESPLRFIPPCIYEGRKRGWFMVQDLISALPLSIFVLICKSNGIIPKSTLFELLSDPIKRHMIIGDLPPKWRRLIMNDKRIAKQIEHMCIMLSYMGLMVIGENPTPHRFISSFTTLFFVCEKGQLYDTSTSEKGFSSVTLPIDKYNKYDYSFNHIQDIYTYWHHLRAIVHSTRLSFRSEAIEGVTGPGRAYSLGTVDKDPVTTNILSAEEGRDPLGPRDGCAGFVSKLCVHLQRHWEPNLRPSQCVAWFISRFRRYTEMLKGIIENRVERLEKQWNSFVRSLMPSDVELLRKKKAVVKDEMIETSMTPCIRASSSLAIEPKKLKKRIGVTKCTAKKRPLDSVDLLSEQNRMHVRSRFNSRERDMLILIRAVGFFLNPVYRFWLNPCVLRDIMHEYVPESRSKTVQSLMAAGVREMVRNNRLAYLQRIVRNLSTFPEMRQLRLNLASNPLTTLESKTQFFKDAFQVANRLLFSESQQVPGVSSSDESFNLFLSSGKVTISSEPTGAQQRPLRSQTPTTLDHLSHCVAVNVLLSTLFQVNSSEFDETILEQIPANIVHQALHTFRTDGLVSRVRSAISTGGKLTNKSHATLSFYFRTFFSHRFHPDIIDMTTEQLRKLDEEDRVSLVDDNVGVVIASLGSFYGKKELDLTVDDSIVSFFEMGGDNEGNSTKQIRYLEGANLHLEKIEVHLSPNEDDDEDNRINNDDDDDLPPLSSLSSFIDRSFILPSPIPSIDDCIDGMNSIQANNIRSLYSSLEEYGVYGISEKSLIKNSSINDQSIISSTLTIMKEKSMIFIGGVDEPRWILMKYAHIWTVELNGHRYPPRPWTLPCGSICLSTIRWLAESVLVAVLAQYGITQEALRFRFEFALQPIVVTELIMLLEGCKCVKSEKKELKDMVLKGPFDDEVRTREVDYVVPTIDAMERFSRIFGSINLLSSVEEE